MGINPHQSSEKHPFNLRNGFATVNSMLSLTSNIKYFFYVANEFEEYTYVVYIFSTGAVSFLIYTMLVWKMEKLFEIFNDFEKLIDDSE